ncbi:hypothetical protein AK812_SmicGene32000 [Symbiodinium microadriaticum]|uniref:Uncharacterized protein n=1 Tax=Symbiodinium microadriaticum TaxID=2951 RepID=A0A1Q9CVA1_SYMMI|nr:hypothetical protein AK812_SmicGene32000 [Symbiodinium microadriaticum]
MRTLRSLATAKVSFATNGSGAEGGGRSVPEDCRYSEDELFWLPYLETGFEAGGDSRHASESELELRHHKLSKDHGLLLLP